MKQTAAGNTRSLKTISGKTKIFANWWELNLSGATRSAGSGNYFHIRLDKT